MSTSLPHGKVNLRKKLSTFTSHSLQCHKTHSTLREAAGQYGATPLYRMLGYFSLIGLLRVHTLLGDFTLALKVIQNIELSQKVRIFSLSS